MSASRIHLCALLTRKENVNGHLILFLSFFLFFFFFFFKHRLLICLRVSNEILFFKHKQFVPPNTCLDVLPCICLKVNID